MSIINDFNSCIWYAYAKQYGVGVLKVMDIPNLIAHEISNGGFLERFRDTSGTNLNDVVDYVISVFEYDAKRNCGRYLLKDQIEFDEHGAKLIIKDMYMLEHMFSGALYSFVCKCLSLYNLSSSYMSDSYRDVSDMLFNIRIEAHSNIHRDIYRIIRNQYDRNSSSLSVSRCIDLVRVDKILHTICEIVSESFYDDQPVLISIFVLRMFMENIGSGVNILDVKSEYVNNGIVYYGTPEIPRVRCSDDMMDKYRQSSLKFIEKIKERFTENSFEYNPVYLGSFDDFVADLKNGTFEDEKLGAYSIYGLRQLASVNAYTEKEIVPLFLSYVLKVDMLRKDRMHVAKKSSYTNNKGEITDQKNSMEYMVSFRGKRFSIEIFCDLRYSNENPRKPNDITGVSFQRNPIITYDCGVSEEVSIGIENSSNSVMCSQYGVFYSLKKIMFVQEGFCPYDW
jgi:hypothetical protein